MFVFEARERQGPAKWEDSAMIVMDVLRQAQLPVCLHTQVGDPELRKAYAVISSPLYVPGLFIIASANTEHPIPEWAERAYKRIVIPYATSHFFHERERRQLLCNSFQGLLQAIAA